MRSGIVGGQIAQSRAYQSRESWRIYTDFSEYPAGAAPADWYAPLEPSGGPVMNALVQADPLFTGATKMRLDATSGTNYSSVYQWYHAGQNKNPAPLGWVEVVAAGAVASRVDQLGGIGAMGLAFGMPTGPQVEGYYLLRLYQNTTTINLQLNYVKAGAPLASPAVGVTLGRRDLGSGVWIVRLRVTPNGSGALLQGKGWKASEGEPAGWQATVQDLGTLAPVLTRGYPMVYALGSMEVYYDTLALAIDRVA